MEICRDWAQWLVEELPMTEEGGFQHLTSDTLNEQELWDDTLFMAVLFLARMGVLLDNKKNGLMKRNTSFSFMRNIWLTEKAVSGIMAGHFMAGIISQMHSGEEETAGSLWRFRSYSASSMQRSCEALFDRSVEKSD